MNRTLSVIIPVYNSQGNIAALVKDILQVCQGLNMTGDIVLVDDCSKDDSLQVITALAAKHKEVTAISLEKNAGQQNAIMCGLRQCIGNYVVTMDDDGQHDPHEIPKLLEKLNQGYDIVYGIPFTKKHSGMRNAGTRFNDGLFRLILGKPKQVQVSSFRVMTASHKEEIIRSNRSFVYLSAITLQHTKNIGNVRTHHKARKTGKSNYNYIRLFKLFCSLAIYYGPWGALGFFSKKPQYIIHEVIR